MDNKFPEKLMKIYYDIKNLSLILVQLLGQIRFMLQAQIRNLEFLTTKMGN